MGSDSHVAQIHLQVDDLLVDTAARSVLRDGKPLKISGLTFDFFHALIDRAPAVVSYDEFADVVWQGRPVTPETIAQRAKLLRVALGDDAAKPRYFELSRGHGYRLVPAVMEVPVGERLTRRRRHWPAAIAAVAGSILLLALFAREKPPPSVAVLPFVDLSAAGDQTYFGDGIAEQMIDELTRLKGVEVVRRTRSFAYRDAAMEASEIAEALGVTTILEGSVRRSGDTLRITAQLVDADTGYHLWSGSFDRSMADTLAVQDEIATAVAGVLGVSLGIGDVNAFRGAGTSNIDAYEYYLRATRGPPGEARVDLLRTALKLDPDYGAALATLSLSIFHSQWRQLVEDVPAVRERGWPLLLRAVDLDPDSAYATTLLGVTSYAFFEWGESERHFRRSIAMKPDSQTLDHHANMLTRTGRSSEALRLYELARRDAGFPAIKPGRHDADAMLALERYRELESLIEDEMLEPRVDVPALRFLIALNRGDRDGVTAWYPSSSFARGLASTQFATRHFSLDAPDRTLTFLRELYEDRASNWPSKYRDIALLAAFLESPEFALEVFSREIRVTPLRYGTLWYPAFAEARRLPRFAVLMGEVGLVRYWREYGWSDHCQPAGEVGFRCF